MFLASKYIDQFVLIGDRRMFVSALIVPDYEALKEYADANRIQYKSVDELVEMKQIYELLDKELDLFQKKLPILNVCASLQFLISRSQSKQAN